LEINLAFQYIYRIFDVYLKQETMEVTQMTSQEAIGAMQSAIKSGDKNKALELYSPDNPDILPDWDNEPDYIWEEWEQLTEKAEKIFRYE
jgi:hypothetical protein